MLTSTGHCLQSVMKEALGRLSWTRALSSAKAVAGASNPVQLGVILDGERMTSAGEVLIGPPEYRALSSVAAGRLLLTTNVGTRVNVRLTGQLPEFPAVEKSAQAVVAAFHPFVDTPDRRPRPLTVRLRVDPPADLAKLAAVVRKLDEARTIGQIGPAGIHRLICPLRLQGGDRQRPATRADRGRD